MFYELTIGEETYKLKLDARNSVLLEKALGKNPLSLFMGMEDGNLPKLDDMLTLFEYALRKYQTKLSKNDVYDIYDAYIEDGHTYDEFIVMIVDIFKTSGYIKEDKADIPETKN